MGGPEMRRRTERRSLMEDRKHKLLHLRSRSDMIGQRGGGLVSLDCAIGEGAWSSDLSLHAMPAVRASRYTRLPCSRSHRNTSSKLPPPLGRRSQACRPPVAAGEWCRGWAGGVPVPTGLRCRLLTSQRCAVQQLTPLSLLKGLPASSCSPTAHEASALPPSLFNRTPPFQLPQPYPALDHNLSVHHKPRPRPHSLSPLPTTHCSMVF